MCLIILFLAIISIPASLYLLIAGNSDEKIFGLLLLIIDIVVLKVYSWLIKDNKKKVSKQQEVINTTPVVSKNVVQTNDPTLNDITVQDIIDKNVEFTDNAIYVRNKVWDGVKWTMRKQKVYVYKRKYHLDMGEPPRFHICKCSTISSFLSRGDLSVEYRKSSDIEIWVKNMDDNNKETKVSHIPLCKNCYKKMKSQYSWLDSKTDNEEFVRRVLKNTDWA